jgi:hypothetical protein
MITKFSNSVRQLWSQKQIDMPEEKYYKVQDAELGNTDPKVREEERERKEQREEEQKRQEEEERDMSKMMSCSIF